MNDRPTNVPFDPTYFARQKCDGKAQSIAATFEQIYRTNHWGSDTVSGAGATARQTQTLVAELPVLFEDLGVDVLLDVPCGDFSWMQPVAQTVPHYIGADIVPDLVAKNQAEHNDESLRFLTLDITSEPLPDADLLFCRDLFVHFSFADIRRALHNVQRSSITYLLTTIFPACTHNEDITTGDWRVLNLEAAPFQFPAPLRLINEQCTEGGGLYRDKSLGLWRVHDLPAL